MTKTLPGSVGPARQPFRRPAPAGPSASARGQPRMSRACSPRDSSYGALYGGAGEHLGGEAEAVAQPGGHGEGQGLYERGADVRCAVDPGADDRHDALGSGGEGPRGQCVLGVVEGVGGDGVRRDGVRGHGVSPWGPVVWGGMGALPLLARSNAAQTHFPGPVRSFTPQLSAVAATISRPRPSTAASVPFRDGRRGATGGRSHPFGTGTGRSGLLRLLVMGWVGDLR